MGIIVYLVWVGVSLRKFENEGDVVGINIEWMWVYDVNFCEICKGNLLIVK